MAHVTSKKLISDNNDECGIESTKKFSKFNLVLQSKIISNDYLDLAVGLAAGPEKVTIIIH